MWKSEKHKQQQYEQEQRQHKMREAGASLHPVPTEPPPPPYSNDPAAGPATRPSSGPAFVPRGSSSAVQHPLLTFPIHYDARMTKLLLQFVSPYPPHGPAYYVASRNKNMLSSQPDLMIYRGDAQGPALACCKLHMWSTTVDIEYQEPLREDTPAKTALSQVSIFQRVNEITIAGRRLLWKGTRGTHAFTSPDLKLVDEGSDKEVYAVLVKDHERKTHRWGRFEVWKDGLSPAVVDQCVVSGVAMYHQLMQNRRTSAGNASAMAGII